MTQKKRLDCIHQDLDQESVNERLLGQCRGNLEHHVRCRIDLNCDLTELIATMEEVVEMMGLNKKTNPLNLRKEKEPMKDVVNKNPSVPPPKKDLMIKCWKCNKEGHKSPDCPSNKKINNVEAELNENQGEEEVYESSEESDSPELDIVVINADIGSSSTINHIQGESSLPQRWDFSQPINHISDAKILTNKPEEGKGYTAGQTSFTTVLHNEIPVKALLDIGAFCSCTSSNFLDKVFPEWKNSLLPIPLAKFSSCNARLHPIGIVSLPLIFPHTKGSLRLKIEFVVMNDAVCEYFIIGNDAMYLYGIDIIQSKGRYFTIGGDFKRKY